MYKGIIFWKLKRKSNVLQKHYPICNLERVIIRLNTNEYEYRPAYYEEVRCNTISRDNAGNYNEVCYHLFIIIKIIY